MKNYSTIKSWFAIALCVAVLAEVYPMIWLGKDTFAASGDEVLVWVEFIVSALFFLTTVSCVFWEWVLSLIRKSDSTASATTPVVVFCGGIISILLNIGLLSLHG